ncbi:hypothetical protein PMAYCL1PPCAC_10030 [Pristionchus mayeri]|uniref:Uncharacterized protein n=1 Tax=Pristionchus mayeri TaxID=1317129 RepID=A0AAN4ZLH5_9BILA|nr:hypothetical protein PMAYCL1PPCAC_10030 [Pristionchus mayeri]
MSSRAEEHARKRALRKRLFKTKTGEEEKTWRQRKDEKKQQKEENMIKEAEDFWKSKVDSEYGSLSVEGSGAKARKVDKSKPYTLNIAIPGSFLLNAQSAELRTYMAGQIARAATLFRVSEVIVYDESARMTDEQLEVYWGGHWHGDVPPADNNIEANFHLARILEYLECPQYLRRALFLKQRPLQYAGLLNPLDSQHHLKAHDLKLRFREGVILDKPVKKGRGPLVDVGLDKELELEDETPLPPGTRVTVEMGPPETDGARRYRGKLTSARKAAAATGQYWGYSVRIAKRIGEVIDHDKYDCIIGTSPNGARAVDLEVDTGKHSNILVVFGGIEGVDAAIEGDEAYAETSAEEAFTLLLRPFVSNGSRSERIEENVLVGLSTVDSRVADLYGYPQ